MSKYFQVFLITTIVILFSACGEENQNISTEVKKPTPINNQAIIFPTLPSKNIETSALDNIQRKQ